MDDDDRYHDNPRLYMRAKNKNSLTHTGIRFYNRIYFLAEEKTMTLNGINHFNLNSVPEKSIQWQIKIRLTCSFVEF